MTIGFAAITLGAIWLFTAFTNRTVRELVVGEDGAGQPPDRFAGISGTTFSDPKGTGTANPDVIPPGPLGPSTGTGTGSSASMQAGVGVFDGKPVAKWIIPWLERSRKAGWKGVVTSGYRTPAYSTSLCIDRCGAPTCPGTCGGASSNHSGKKYPAGAVDVTDEVTFASVQRRIGSPLRNDLPADRVHFSVSGH